MAVPVTRLRSNLTKSGSVGAEISSEGPRAIYYNSILKSWGKNKLIMEWEGHIEY